MKAPKVSLIIPVFNQRRYLRESVLSAVNESLPEGEIIVVDDASNDESLQTINDLPVRLIRLETNVGVAAATNVGIRAARGEYLAFLDSDDLLVAGGLKWRLAWLEKHPEAVAVAGRPAGIIDAEGSPLPQYRHLLHPDYVPPDIITLDYFRAGGAYPVPQWLYLFRRSVFTEIGMLNETLKLAHDCEFLFRVLKKYSIPVVFEPVALRRLHTANSSLCADEANFNLSPETIATCEKIFASFGIKATQWNLWERGYRDSP